MFARRQGCHAQMQLEALIGTERNCAVECIRSCLLIASKGASWQALGASQLYSCNASNQYVHHAGNDNITQPICWLRRLSWYTPLGCWGLWVGSMHSQNVHYPMRQHHEESSLRLNGKLHVSWLKDA